MRHVAWPLTLLFGAALCMACSAGTDLSNNNNNNNNATYKDAGVGLEAGADTGAADKGTGKDTSTPDQGVTDKGISTKGMGLGCISNKECTGSGQICLLYSNIFTWIKTAGLCTRACTPDKSSTPLVNEDNCPTGFMCATFRYSSGNVNYCLQTCKPSLTTNTCAKSSKTTCHPRSAQYAGGTGKNLCIWPACQSDKDCPVLGSTTCTKDTDCTSLGNDAYCEKSTQKCARPGKCSPGGLCSPHKLGKTTAKVGDPCKSDFDCPNGGSCLTESASSSRAIGVNYRNGYCTVPFCSANLAGYSCPTGSECDTLYYGGLCFKSCKLDSKTDCRGNIHDKGGDYECYAWNNLNVGGHSVTKGPVCLSAATATCDFLGTKLDCSSLGLKGNTTHMSCRDRFTGAKKSQKRDKTGICLDDTASGPFQTVATDAGTPDK